MVIAPCQWHWSGAGRAILEPRWCTVVVYQSDEAGANVKNPVKSALVDATSWNPRLVWRLLVLRHEVPQGQGPSLAPAAGRRIRRATPAQREVRPAPAWTSRPAPAKRQSLRSRWPSQNDGI